jgi:hypothetical protein
MPGSIGVMGSSFVCCETALLQDGRSYSWLMMLLPEGVCTDFARPVQGRGLLSIGELVGCCPAGTFGLPALSLWQTVAFWQVKDRGWLTLSSGPCSKGMWLI